MKKMKTTTLQKQAGIWQQMKEAAKNMWKWSTAAQEELKLPYHLKNEEGNEKMLIEQDEIPGTPFKVTGHKTKGYWITLGPYRLTLAQKTKKQAMEDLVDEKWNIIARLVQVTNDFEKNIKPNLENNNK